MLMASSDSGGWSSQNEDLAFSTVLNMLLYSVVALLVWTVFVFSLV
jgi:hypothetical protein